MVSPIEEIVSSEQSSSFHRDGAVHLQGVLNDKWVELLAEGLDECYEQPDGCLLYTSPSPRDLSTSRMPSSA